jgi:DNA transformation protein
MNANRELVEHCVELLAPMGAVHSRRMFGGFGLTIDDLFVALVLAQRLYMKADDISRPHFVAAGCTPFAYTAKGRTVTLNYWTAPPQAMESPALMQPWVRLALEAALRTRASLRPPKRVKADAKRCKSRPGAGQPAAKKASRGGA